MSDLKKYQYRERCLREKGEQCIACGVEEEIVVHHVDGDRNNNDMDNLIPVCGDCHAAIHAGRVRVAKWVRKLGKYPRSGEMTNIPVSDEVWEHLDAQKGRNVSFDDILRDELGIGGDDEAAHAAHD